MLFRSCGLGRRCTLHFRCDGESTLYVRVFGEDGRHVGCFPEDNDGGEVLGLGDGRNEDEGEPALGTGHASSSYDGSSLGDISSSGGYDQPPRRRAPFEGGGGSSRRRASVKREEGPTRLGTSLEACLRGSLQHRFCFVPLFFPASK